MRSMFWLHRPARAAALVALLLPVVAAAQQSTANWALADKFSPDKLRPLVYTTTVNARFIGQSDSLWYNWKDHNGSAFYLVVPAVRTKKPLFDHERLAAQLSAQNRKPVDATNLPFTNLRFSEDHKAIIFMVDSVRFEYGLGTQALRSLGKLNREEMQRELRLQNEGQQQGGRGGGGGGGGGQFGGGANQDFRNYSPDSTAYVYAMDHNLYLVEVKGDTTPVKLSSDGVRYYSFGSRDSTENQIENQDDEQERQQGGRSRDPRVRAQVTWSPDSKAFAVQRSDSRSVKELYLVNVLAAPRPTLMSYKYAMPGEDSVAQQELFVFKRGERQLTRLTVDKYKDQRLFDIHFPVGSDRLRLVRRDRLQRNLEFIEIDLASKAIKPLISESTENAYLERQNVRYVKSGGDFIWWSERSGWGHFYLYDHGGKLKNTITSGPWRAEQIVEVDSVTRTLWFAAVGKEQAEWPYYRHLYRVPVDGGAIALLDKGDATHQSRLSPSKRFVIDTYSRIDMVPKSVLRDASGAQIMELETMDVSRLQELGWKAPERFMVKAADGVTDIYGNMWKPFDFDPNKKYPIIAHVYPGPQTEQVTFPFTATPVQQQLAQLGFIVIQIGNRGGSPQRSNAYHSFGYYNLRDYGLADKKAGIEQLAARHAFIDIDKVGIYGHSGGGFMTAAALLQPPYNDFFKVGVSSAGNHDNNVYNQNWSEQHHGLKEERVLKNTIASNQGQRGQGQQRGNGNGNGQRGNAQGQGQQGQSADAATKAATDTGDESLYTTKFTIDVPDNAELAANLKGKLLLVHGDMDNNVHPAGTIRLVNALIKANKRFDMMIMPGKPHGFGDMQPYFNRLLMEYFSEHLIGDYLRKSADIK